MRQIDADALIADLEHDVAIDEDMLDCEELTEDRREIIQFDKDCKQNAIDLLNHAPTIEPRKRGKWVNTGSGQECSVCYEIQYGYDNHRYFCPNCGADMRGERNETD